MKIISHILSLFLSGMKAEDISIELIYVILVLKAKWLLLIALINHAMKAFNCTHTWAGNQVSHGFALCN